MTRRFGEDHPLEEKNSYKEFVEYLVLNNKILYSDVPYHLRIHNLALFYYAVRVARDHLQDGSQFVSVMEQFLLDIDEIEKQSEVNMGLRRRALDAILGVEKLFAGVVEFDEFIQQQKRTRTWLFTN